MIDRSLRYRIVTGAFTLPIAVLLALFAAILNSDSLITTLGIALSAYLLAELNNRYSLLRIRSRLISVSYLLVMTACPAVWQASDADSWLLCSMLLSYFLLFASYQRTRPEGYVFYAFLFCGISTLFFPPFLFSAAGFYISMLFQLRNMTWRTFSAGLFGLLVPILLVLPWLSYSELTRLASKFSECVALPSMGDYEPFLMEHGITVAVTAFLLLIAVAHFFRTSYNDKIKTRMFYYVIATQELIWTVLMAIRPSEFQSTFTVWAGCSAFFLGHYFALARGRFFNIWFYTCAVVLVLLCVYNHLIRFQLFSSVCV